MLPMCLRVLTYVLGFVNGNICCILRLFVPSVWFLASAADG